MSEHLPPTIDPVAAARWHAMVPQASPWLHEEVARRMQDRLQWIVKPPAAWCDWDPVRGGIEGHALVGQRFAQAASHIAETSSPAGEAAAQAHFGKAWWSPARWSSAAPRFGVPPDGGVQMLWSNMALHMAADPQALIARWHKALAVDGYLMFSCLGPDTLREPVMDMERIVLTFATPARLLQELRGLGRNLHPQRFPALRGRRWHANLEQALSQRLADARQGGQLALTFEIVYGHAFKPTPRVRMEGSSAVALQDMRDMLRAGRHRER
jgi:malonyl-CoA O-methyltransferase